MANELDKTIEELEADVLGELDEANGADAPKKSAGKADPMGGTDAAEVTVTSVSSATYTRYLFQGNSSMHTQFTVSYFLKYVDHQWMMLRPIFWSGGEDNKTWFDIENGVIGTNNNDSATIEAYPNGWYRCSVTFTIDPSTDPSGYVHVQAMDGDGGSAQANSVKYEGCFSRGEDKDFPTSYIPVASDTYTCNKDTRNSNR